jgi:hypothetical protein
MGPIYRVNVKCFRLVCVMHSRKMCWSYFYRSVCCPLGASCKFVSVYILCKSILIEYSHVHK